MQTASAASSSASPAQQRVKSVEVVDPLDDARRPGRGGRVGLLGPGRGGRPSHPVRYRARPETVLHNARELRVDLSGVTDVILSHHHGDHTGGLLTLRRELARQNPEALKRAYVGAGIFLSRPGPDGRETNEADGSQGRSTRLWEDRSWSSSGRPRFPGGLADRAGPADPSRTELEPQTHDPKAGRPQVEDNVPEDMSLVLDTEKGLVVGLRLRPCRHHQHPGIRSQEGPARPASTRPSGGFHLFEADAATLDWTAAKLRSMAVGELARGPLHGDRGGVRLRQRLGLGRATAPSARWARSTSRRPRPRRSPR